MPEIMQQPDSPDALARRAGRDLYETPVGILRRAELWRLGNAWGLKFPIGASKDYMLPFFKQMEAEGKNPLRPPGGNLDELVRTHDVTHSDEDHSEEISEPEPLVPVKVEPVDTIVSSPDGKTYRVVGNQLIEVDVPAPTVIEPTEEKTEFELKLEALPMAQLKKICKMRGIVQLRTDRKKDLIARIVAAST